MEKEKNNSSERCKPISRRHPLISILTSAGLGLGLACLLFVSFDKCIFTICDWVLDNPPWTLLTAIATAPSVILLWYWRTVHKEEDLANDTKRITTDRFAKAVEQLGNKKVEIQVGGIYHLQKIMEEDPDYHWPIIQTLLHYIRTKSPRKPEGENKPITPNVQTAIDVICQRKPELDNERLLDFSNTNLTGARFQFPSGSPNDWSRVNLKNAFFEYCCLDNAIFTNAYLFGSQFNNSKGNNTYFCSADLTGAHLGENAEFINCDFGNARLADSKLGGSLFYYCNFVFARMNKRTHFLSKTGKPANIDQSNFDNVHLNTIDRPYSNEKTNTLEGAAKDYLKILNNVNNIESEEIKKTISHLMFFIKGCETETDGLAMNETEIRRYIDVDLLNTLIVKYGEESSPEERNIVYTRSR